MIRSAPVFPGGPPSAVSLWTVHALRLLLSSPVAKESFFRVPAAAHHRVPYLSSMKPRGLVTPQNILLIDSAN